MDTDPFNRVPLPAPTPRRSSSLAVDPGAQQFVPAFALERQPGAAQSFNVILAIIASGATFVEKTGCDSGTPYTYWAPEWTDDPTP